MTVGHAEVSDALARVLGGYAQANGEPVSTIIGCACGCSGREFRVEVDDAEGCARRTCTACGERVLMLDSAETVDEADLGDAQCPCGQERFEAGVGFAAGVDGEIRWVYVGLRCVSCGQAGVYADWGIDYAPSRQLLAQA